MVMKNHPHPGELLREDIYCRLGLDVAGAAKRLRVSCSTLSRVLDGRTSISPDLAMRLERSGFSSARFWMALQSNYDQWRAELELARMLDGITPDNLHGEVDFGSATGCKTADQNKLGRL
ncbi:virulence-associated protein A [Burkholderia pseudomallei]|nr:HigA family addiction module antitoxin [Burkholderia vietnamiensis]OAB10110.1 HigA family addiction module antitoxin [Burkholderia pseudomallei]OMR71181.1 HigA family addiction module antitoxin [Burkholderia pseudomallei]ONE83964.1 HigA family addiction module antitoxin [Burkholderia pseudomallei]CAJ3056462.1 virulence-associated protein A [Burkholderia pseudomallei]